MMVPGFKSADIQVRPMLIKLLALGMHFIDISIKGRIE
jgi:hypothetical protein